MLQNMNGKLYDWRDYFKEQVTEQPKINLDTCENLRKEKAFFYDL